MAIFMKSNGWLLTKRIGNEWEFLSTEDECINVCMDEIVCFFILN